MSHFVHGVLLGFCAGVVLMYIFHRAVKAELLEKIAMLTEAVKRAVDR